MKGTRTFTVILVGAFTSIAFAGAGDIDSAGRPSNRTSDAFERRFSELKALQQKTTVSKAKSNLAKIFELVITTHLGEQHGFAADPESYQTLNGWTNNIPTTVDMFAAAKNRSACSMRVFNLTSVKIECLDSKGKTILETDKAYIKKPNQLVVRIGSETMTFQAVLDDGLITDFIRQ